jgi:hypothetical protein
MKKEVAEAWVAQFGDKFHQERVLARQAVNGKPFAQVTK